MKKSLLVLLCVFGLGVAGLASAQSSDFSFIERLLNTLEGQMAELKASQPAQVSSSVAAKKITTVKNSDSAVSIASNDDPIDGNPDPVPGNVLGCRGGATMPAGSTGQTVYCNGTRWVNNSNLSSNGSSVIVGTGIGFNGLNKFSSVGGHAQTAIYGFGNIGVYGQAPLDTEASVGVSGSGRVGVLGSVAASGGGSDTKVAIKAKNLTTTNPNVFGFFQEGNGKNYFEGKVGLGTQNPAESLDLGGGNIKMGYEVVNRSIDNGNYASVSCPVGKFAIGGGCRNASNTPASVKASVPLFSGSVNVANGWSCDFSDHAGTMDVFAICANIR